jgi:hypothetical protein
MNCTKNEQVTLSNVKMFNFTVFRTSNKLRASIESISGKCCESDFNSHYIWADGSKIFECGHEIRVDFPLKKSRRYSLSLENVTWDVKAKRILHEMPYKVPLPKNFTHEFYDFLTRDG